MRCDGVPANSDACLIYRASSRTAAMKEEIAFGHWLKQRRKALDLTQEELAGRIGCATSTLQKIEAGKRRPSGDFAARIAEVLRVEPDKRPAFIAFARGSQEILVRELFLPPTNLPAPATPLIGRKAEVADVCKRLLREDTRLITLVGPPGVGKTRLSLQVASEVRHRFDDGVFFVPLAAITDTDLLAPTIAGSLGLKESGHRAPGDHLCDYLRYKLMLLMLDNFEQVVEAAPLVAKLLSSCRLLKVLVTSRMPLRLRAERQYPVRPLATPDLTKLPPPLQLTRYPAVALFADRAEAVQPEFSITKDNALAVATICHRLDGLPLAVELISAHIKILHPSELLSRLDRSLLLGSDGLRDLDERQHTLKNAIEWSYSLLSEPERSLFACLGAFVGGWTLEGIESVYAQTEPDSARPTFELLRSLIDKSLVMQQPFHGERRFTMLETIREYALHKLKASGELEEIRGHHARYYLSLIETMSPQLKSSLAMVNRIEREHDNLREALRWSIQGGHIETAVRLVTALTSLWTIHTWHLREGRKWHDRVLVAARDRHLPPLEQARLLQEAGILAYLQGDYEASRALHQWALTLARESKDDTMVAHALHGLSNAAMNQGKFEEVAALLEECLPLARSTGEYWLVAMALNNLAEIERLQGKIEQAEQKFKEGLEILAQIGDQYFTPILLDGLGTIAQYRRDYEGARVIHRQCLSLSRELDDRRIIALTLEKLAGVATGQGQGDRAARLLGAAEALREAIHVQVESIDRGDYDRIVAMTRASMEADRLSDAWAEGGAMDLEQAIEYALEDLPVKSLSHPSTSRSENVPPENLPVRRST
jgi:predicted ATPase/DNA-binding XRE family transcriptional regulator/tetratricopeptide (TPR) repeat protein